MRIPAPEPRPDPLIPTIFHEPWWLNTVTGGQYEEAVVVQSGQKIGSFPYVTERRMPGGAVCTMPLLTHFLGPAIDEGKGAACNRVLRRAQITRELLAQVKSSSGFWQKLHRFTPETLVYQEQGFATSVQFTFEVAPALPAILWRNMRDKTRNVIRRAQEAHAVADCRDMEEFASVYNGNLEAAGTQTHYPTPLIVKVCQAAIAHGQGRVLGVRDAEGRLLAAIFYIWDAKAAYYLLSTRRQDSGNGAVSLLVWEAMQDIASRGLIFDFEGVPSAGSALFFTGFGGEIAPRYIVSRFSLKHRLGARIAKPFRSRSRQTYL